MQASIAKVFLNDGDSPHTVMIRTYVWIMAAVWTVVVAGSMGWSYRRHDHEISEFSRAEARAALDRDQLYRSWGAMHGGVYVPVTVKTPPNPSLSHVPDRDAVTPTGRPLTLINPSYMIRQIHELARETGTIGQGHLSSLKPNHPDNAPDPWERRALLQLEAGTGEISEMQEMNGQRFMRMIRAFVTEKPCLKCHAVQGYKVGDVRGGLSVSIPVATIEAASHQELLVSAITHGCVWILGLGVIWRGNSQLSRSSRLQRQAEDELHLLNLQLEEEIAGRQLAQEALQESAAHLLIVAEYAFNWEYWRMPDDSFRYISPSVVEITGYGAYEFMEDSSLLSSIIHPDDRELFRRHAHVHDAGGNIEPVEFRIITKGGEVRWISHVCRQVHNADGLPWGWRASNQDITARKQMEHELFEQTRLLEDEVAEREAAQEQLEQLNRFLENRVGEAVDSLRRKDQALIQQNRLAAMGEMINNIAHQWRQPLNNIGLIIQNLQYSFEAGSITREEMESEIRKAMDIILNTSRIIDDFRNFFREDREVHAFFVNKAVMHALEFVSAVLERHNIRVEIQGDNDVTAAGYQNEYSQVLLNIISNSREAALERNVAAPCITIRIASEGGRSVLCIRDNCGGIPEDVLPKIFDPYFTTREPGKGSGIGLYMSKVIIEQHMNGSLTARNVDGGAEFRIEV